MYATKPLSLLKSHPEAVSMPPPEGRNSGYFVVKGNAADEDDGQTSYWGSWPLKRVWELPFPQDRVLKVEHEDAADAIVFVPVPDQPLASNRYYAVIATGYHKGLIRTCSREEDMITCFCRRCIQDVDPRPFNPANIYQQMEIVQRERGLFTAKAVAADGFPTMLLRSDWRVYVCENKKFNLGEASGIDDALRSRWLCHAAGRPGAFPAPANAAVVGRWYCPFYAIKEDGVALHKQMKRSTFYEVVLEQRWEPVHSDHGRSKIARKKALIGGSVEAIRLDARSSRYSNTYVWFRALSTQQRVGLCTGVWERMLWVQRRGGWIGEEVEDEAGMATNGSVLVERFVVKMMDGSVVLAFDFAHLNKVRE